MKTKRILSVGQCAADHASIARAIQGRFDVEVVPVDTGKEAADRLRQDAFDLVLVNRLLDGDGSSGLDVLKQFKADPALSQTRVMLVTNFEEYQQQAVAAGAMPGFGKAALGQPRMVARLRAVLGDETRRAIA